MKIHDIMDCPGAWYGNSPNQEFHHGHVIVDPSRARDAFEWLRKRFWLLETNLTEDKGLCIGIQLKIKVAA